MGFVWIVRRDELMGYLFGRGVSCSFPSTTGVILLEDNALSSITLFPTFHEHDPVFFV